MDSFEPTGVENGTEQNCSIDQLQISQAIQELDYVPLFLSEKEIKDKELVERIQISNSYTVQDLSSGLLYCFGVAPIDTCTNDSITNLSISSCAPTGKLIVLLNCSQTKFVAGILVLRYF